MNPSQRYRGVIAFPLRPTLLIVLVLVISAFLLEREQTVVVASTAGEYEITVEIADTDREVRTGLMGRTHLAGDHGMLFDMRRRPSVGMWMKNVPIALDMLFLDAAGRVIHIKKAAAPNSTALIHPEGPFAAVLELPSGTADRLGIEPGAEVRHRMFGNGP